MKSSECRAKLKKYSAELCSPHLVDVGTVWPLLRKQQIFSENACVKIDEIASPEQKMALILRKVSKCGVAGYGKLVEALLETDHSVAASLLMANVKLTSFPQCGRNLVSGLRRSFRTRAGSPGPSGDQGPSRDPSQLSGSQSVPELALGTKSNASTLARSVSDHHFPQESGFVRFLTKLKFWRQNPKNSPTPSPNAATLREVKYLLEKIQESYLFLTDPLRSPPLKLSGDQTEAVERIAMHREICRSKLHELVSKQRSKDEKEKARLEMAKQELVGLYEQIVAVRLNVAQRSTSEMTTAVKTVENGFKV